MLSLNQVMTMELPSTKPYLIRALHEWCCDNGFTPHIVVAVDQQTYVPREFVRDGQIVLNIGYAATKHLKIANDGVSFQARFGGVAREILVPIGNVLAIYSKGNGAGIAFERDSEKKSLDCDASSNLGISDSPDTSPPAPFSGRAKLQRIK